MGYSAEPAWPRQVLKFVNPNVAGGTSDILGRMVGIPLAKALGQPVIVDNRPGGNGNVGAALVAQATDGHTVMVSDIPSLAISETLYQDLPYKLDRDLQAVAMLAYSPHVFAVTADLQAHDLQGLVALSKKRRVNIALPFLGTPNHLGALELAQRVGLSCQFVPYKGGAQALADTVGGTADLVVTSVLPAIPLLQARKLRAVGISGRARSPLLPQVRTIAEQGAPGFETGSWQGVTAPRRMAETAVDRLQVELLKIARSADFARRLTELGAEAAPQDRREMAAFIKQESAR
ncbi:Bug family tripartite tricarboxylate transporter substrate binding protein [Xylophilus sp.]|uniref:Bug family tripartite tricarboxylate transporter substrate binding protein n=1 Tax=Xylophilus sp. TaxID=2653893 RepID=UPI002D7EDAF9|nr:tripartite tricarboxylate transporter substrate binding protein [Xylophilus sp.]